MINMMVLVIAMKSLRLSSRPNFHAQGGIHNRMAGICMFRLSIIVVCRFVNKDRKYFVDEGIYKPFVAESLASSYKTSAASGLRRE
jgi:hypothetical protein